MPELIISLIVVLLSFFLGIIIERLKSKPSQIKKIRILCLDAGITKQEFSKIIKYLKQSSILKNILIIEDYQGDVTFNFMDSLITSEKGFARKIPTQKIEEYECKENEFDKRCVSSTKLKNRLEESNKDPTLAIFAITTFPLFNEKKKKVWVNGGTYDELRKEEKNIFAILNKWINREASKISILPIQKEKIIKSPDKFLMICEHSIAHLLGISNYRFAC